MTRADLTGLRALKELDRFLQWDLITITPFGSPAVAPVGARLLPEKAEIWSSTTVGYSSKVRNIRLHPRVALLRAEPGAPAVLLRGEASIVGGDGTANLGRLFELMGGAGASRPFFEETANSPLWRALYREYWRRILIRVRLTEVCLASPGGWQTHPLRAWKPQPAAQAVACPRPCPGPAARRVRGGLDLRGREMLADGVPTLLALVDEPLQAPVAFPVEARPGPGGLLQVRSRPGLSPGRSRRASLAVRLVDDSFEVARMVGWIGSLEQGDGWREFRPRSAYGFAKPPGVVPDIAAALAATLMNVRSQSAELVSPPRLTPSAAGPASSPAARLRLPELAWTDLEQLFLSCAAAAPWHAAMATMAADQASRSEQAYLAERVELERDWAHALLLRGGRRLQPAGLARAGLLSLPRSLNPRTEWLRQERLRQGWRSELRGMLPDQLRRGLLPSLGAAEPVGGAISRPTSVAGAAVILAGSMAATFDRLLPIRRR